jgi:uncharacterized protein
MAIEKRLSIWKEIGLFISVFIVQIIFSVGGTLVLTNLATRTPIVGEDLNDPSVWGWDKNLVLLFGIGLSFYGASIALWLVMKYAYKTSLKSLITSRKNIDFRKIKFTAFSWVAILTATGLVQYLLAPKLFSFNLNALSLLLVFLTALITFPLQATFEEIYYRGYLWQIIERHSNLKYLPLVLTSLLFAIIHLPYVGALDLGMIPVVYYFIISFLLGYFKQASKSLELGIGYHVSNNFFQIVFLRNYYFFIPSDSLVFVNKGIDMWIYACLFLAGTFSLLYVLNRKYKLSDLAWKM